MTPPSGEHTASWLQHHQPTCSGMSPGSAVLTSGAAYWASWAESLHMIEQRHPAVANQILHELTHHQEAGFHVTAASTAREELIQVGFYGSRVVTSGGRVTSHTTGGRPPNRHAWRWVATGSHRRSPHTLGRDVCQTKVECHRAGYVAVSGWALVFLSVVCQPVRCPDLTHLSSGC